MDQLTISHGHGDWQGEQTKMTRLNSGPDALVTEPVTLINPFTMPPGETEQFLDHWRNSAGIMAAQPGFVRAHLYRALDDAAELRFVNVAHWGSGRAFDQARANPEFRTEGQRVLDAPQLHITGRPGVYQIVVVVHSGDVREPTHDDVRDHYRSSRPTGSSGQFAPGANAGVSEPVTLINPFTMPPAESERFLHRWRASAPIMAAQPGAIGGHLYRTLDDESEIRFVNVAEFDSSGAYERAWTDPEWRASVQRMQDGSDLHAIARPALYKIAIQVRPGELP